MQQYNSTVITNKFKHLQLYLLRPHQIAKSLTSGGAILTWCHQSPKLVAWRSSVLNLQLLGQNQRTMCYQWLELCHQWGPGLIEQEQCFHIVGILSLQNGGFSMQNWCRQVEDRLFFWQGSLVKNWICSEIARFQQLRRQTMQNHVQYIDTVKYWRLCQFRLPNMWNN